MYLVHIRSIPISSDPMIMTMKMMTTMTTMTVMTMMMVTMVVMRMPENLKEFVIATHCGKGCHPVGLAKHRFSGPTLVATRS